MTTKTVFANMGRLLSGKIAAGLISLIYIAIAARTLGVRDYGVLNLVHGYAALMGGLIAFSGFHGVVTYGAEAISKGQPKRLSNLIWLMSLIEVAMAILAIIAAILLIGTVGRLMNWPPEAVTFAPLYTLAILATVRATPWGLLQLADRFDLIGAHQAVMPFVRLIGVLVILAIDGGLTAFLWVWLLSAIMEGLSMWVMAWWVYRNSELVSILQFNAAQARRENSGLLKFIATTNFDLTMRDFAPKAMPLMIGWILGPAATGLYTLALRASAVLYQPAQMLAQAGYSVIAKLIVARDFRSAKAAIRHSVLISTGASILVAAIIAVFSAHILKLLGGNEFTDGATLLALMAAGRAIMAGTPILSSAVTILGKPGKSVTANLISNLALLPFLAPMLWWLGLNGAGWHAILQGTVLSIMLLLAYHNEMKKADR